ncbi:MAG TPA: acetate--CoA ligase family protein [Solirubrobacteraceae bacterium]|nr:acetate--CoA ligase family protein [Solirubrobacteraceae bacterium]
MTALQTPEAGRHADLGRLLRPSSIAVVGATDRAGSYAAETLVNLELIGFPGPVYGVNPKRSEVMGRVCVPSVAELPEPVDAVVVAIPAAGVAAAIDQAGALGCGGAVVFSAGFGEVESGRGYHDDLVAAARRHGLPVCGPNCNGIVSPYSRTALWGDAFSVQEYDPTHPAVALVSQSGNVAVNALATRRGLRFHTVIASGNQAVLTAADYLEFLAGETAGVGSIALYLEDDGGPALVDGLAACADARIPVVVLKVGRSPAGARAAAAHSGALAGDQRVFRSVVEEAGAVWADDVHELLELSKTIAARRTSARRHTSAQGLAIMTCSGGDSAQGADEAHRLGLELPALAPQTQARLAELLPSAATVANPLDYTAMIWGDVPALGELVRILGEDPAIGHVLVFYDQPHGMTGAPAESWRAVREGVMLGASLSPVPVMVSSTLPELLDDAAAAEFAAAGVPAAAGLRTGLRCAAAALQAGAGADPARLREIAAAARATAAAGADGDWLPEHEAKELLRAAGVAVPGGLVVEGEDDAVAAWRELGGPVALKLSAARVQHKTELGGVALGLDSESDVRGAHQRLAALAREHDGSILVERMAPPGVELIVAAHTDAVVPALVIGLGGIWTELLHDVAVVPLPADAPRIERAIASLRGAPLLLGGRGRPAADVAAAARLAEQVGALLLERGLATVECNPVLVGNAAPTHPGAVAVDAAIRTRRRT